MYVRFIRVLLRDYLSQYIRLTFVKICLEIASCSSSDIPFSKMEDQKLIALANIELANGPKYQKYLTWSENELAQVWKVNLEQLGDKGIWQRNSVFT